MAAVPDAVLGGASLMCVLRRLHFVVVAGAAVAALERRRRGRQRLDGGCHHQMCASRCGLC